ncbi:MAG: NADH-quinone oxidoreductase subunit C [Acidobacteriota bacterium]|uniref:NADH-quinone oxidoreductase subunit C n=1 Tax=Thermoanaerobaculum aquaticum TaxID=1312852 RepID=A0A7C2N8X2_9BACT
MSEENKVQEPAPPKMPWEEKPVPPQPQDAREHPLVRELESAVPGAVVEAVEFAGQVSVVVGLEQLMAVLSALKGLGYKFLVDLTAVDWKDRPEGRFDVVYWLHRHADSARLRVKVRVADGVEVPTTVELWPTANWMEREVFDMFGIYFANHPNLERILTWEGFSGHPLRKDFPIEGVDTGAAVYPDIYPPGGGPVKPKGGA